MGKVEAEFHVPVTQESCEVLARLDLCCNLTTGILTGKIFSSPTVINHTINIAKSVMSLLLIIKLFPDQILVQKRGGGHEVLCLSEAQMLFGPVIRKVSLLQ